MALNPLALSRLMDMMQPGQAIASMGYPDIIFPPDLLAGKLGPHISNLVYREDSLDICKRHGMKYRPVPDAASLLGLFGCSLDVFDVKEDRGGEIVLDLNYPTPVPAKYDYVLDVGTLEHCFNVGQALMNMAGLVKVGGVVIHDNPFNHGNHGFYGINPTLYGDFYTDNGFEIVECRLVNGHQSCAVNPWRRFTFFEDEANTFVIARRVEIKNFIYPTQRKYRGKNRGEDRNGGPDAGSERGAGELQHAAPA